MKIFYADHWSKSNFWQSAEVDLGWVVYMKEQKHLCSPKEWVQQRTRGQTRSVALFPHPGHSLKSTEVTKVTAFDYSLELHSCVISMMLNVSIWPCLSLTMFFYSCIPSPQWWPTYLPLVYPGHKAYCPPVCPRLSSLGLCFLSVSSPTSHLPSKVTPSRDFSAFTYSYLHLHSNKYPERTAIVVTAPMVWTSTKASHCPDTVFMALWNTHNFQ